MLGEVGRSVHYPIVKAGGIIVLHGKGIVAAIFINKADLLDLIFIPVQFIKNFHQILCNGFVADELAGAFHPAQIIMKDAHIA